MDFFNSLSEVAKNRNNFKKWEENQKDQQAQREALYKKHPISDAELQKAKEYGETIIDVVDIMDNHSENVAENVETATQPLVGTVPLAVLFGSIYLSAKNIIKPAEKAINKIADEMYGEKNSKTQELINKINANIDKEADAKGFKHRVHIGEYSIRRKKEIRRISDPALRKEAEELLIKYNKKTAAHVNKIKYLSWIIPAVSFITTFIGANIYAAKIQCDSSKIARYQARKTLEDPKAFVSYTPEQIKKAKEELKKHPERIKEDRKSKLNGGMIKSIRDVLKDRRAYKDAAKNDTDESKKVTRHLTPEELIRAKKDQEVIQRTVRIINNEAEKYSENMEVAANVIMNATPFLGAGVGWIISAICNATNVFDNKISSLVKQYGSEDAQKAFEEYKNIKPKQPGKNGAWRRFWGEMVDSGREYTKDGSRAVKKSGFLDPVKRMTIPVAATKRGRNVILGVIGGFITGIVGSLIGLKLQKSAARAGRYTAKRELEKDPRNFIGYTDDEFNEVKNVKNHKKDKNKIKEYAMFIPTVMKQYYAYNKYQNGEYKLQQAFRDELNKLEVSAEQMRDAKNLQRKVFNTFEKVDDNSQIYSESMEAATEIAQPFIYYGGGALALSPIIYFGVQAARGKYAPKIILDKVTNFFSKGTGVMKKKWFKNYLDDVAKNIPDKIKAHNAKGYTIDKSSLKYTLTDMYMKGLKEDPAETLKVIRNIVDENLKTFKNASDAEVKTFMEKLSNQHMFNRTLSSLELETMDKAYLMKVLPRVQKILNDIPDKELKKITDAIVKEYTENPERFMSFIEHGSIKGAFVTPKLQKMLAAAGISWVAFTFILTYTIESIMADMQLKAGRLGVMKAIESLKDPAYYADIEIKPESKPIQINNAQDATNLLNKMKKN